MAFRFLSTTEFECLIQADKLAYLSDAMEELERIKAPPKNRGWNSLFTLEQQEQQQLEPQPQQQAQQQQQEHTEPKDKPCDQ